MFFEGLDENCGPLSEIILSGSPNCLYRFSKSSFAVSSEVRFLLQGSKITPFEKPWSTTTRIDVMIFLILSCLPMYFHYF